QGLGRPELDTRSLPDALPIYAEHALDTEYARRLGVDLEDLLVSQPDCGEQALEITDTLVRTGAIDLIVVDSVAALTPRAEIEGEDRKSTRLNSSHVNISYAVF